MDGLKKCSRCGEEKPRETFSTDRRASDGRHSWCNPCARIRADERRSANPNAARVASQRYRARQAPGVINETYRSWYVAKRFGITLAEYDERKAAVTKCGICGTREPGKRGWMLDHCHSSGDVREFLCSNCNTGIGLFKDDPDRLLAAATYLMRHQKMLEKLLPGMAEE